MIVWQGRPLTAERSNDVFRFQAAFSIGSVSERSVLSLSTPASPRGFVCLGASSGKVMRLTTGERRDQAGVMSEGSDIRPLFFEGARTIVGALADPAVEAAWDRPSVLEEQLVSSVAGHLARSGIWVVADYLATGTPTERPDFGSASDYFAAVAVGASPDIRRAVRDRGAAVAVLGREEILRRSRETLNLLETNLADLPGGHLMAVMDGKVMTLSDYLTTRVVEQAVHLDDLARSVGREPWPLPKDHHTLAISVATDIACRVHGSDATVRALYRGGFAEETFPVF